MSKYVLSAGADADLNEIWECIAQDNLGAADRWIERLFDAFDALAKTPGIGHQRRDLTSLPVLFWPVGRYLIIYRLGPNRIEIAAITQGGRDIPSFFGERS